MMILLFHPQTVYVSLLTLLIQNGCISKYCIPKQRSLQTELSKSYYPTFVLSLIIPTTQTKLESLLCHMSSDQADIDIFQKFFQNVAKNGLLMYTSREQKGRNPKPAAGCNTKNHLDHFPFADHPPSDLARESGILVR